MTTWNVDAAQLVEHIVPVMTIWREASGEGAEGMLAVAWVIVNRSKKRGLTYSEVCLQHDQFSSMGQSGDPALMHWPAATDASFTAAWDAWTAARTGSTPDPTDGSDMYFADTIRTPYWAAACTFTVKINSQLFYRS